jgi:hypothetical protein
MDLGRDAEPFEHLRRPGLEGVAVAGQDHVLELRVALGVEVILGALEELLLLGHGLPGLLVAHHGHVEDRRRFVPEVVLLEIAQGQALGNGEGARRGRFPAGEDAQERRLARAVRAHQAVAVARSELERDVLEQGLGSKVLREAGDGDHGELRVRLWKWWCWLGRRVAARSLA